MAKKRSAAVKQTAEKNTDKSKKSTKSAKNTAGAGRGRSTGKTPAKETKRTVAKKKSFIKTEVSSIILIALGIFLLLTDFGLMGNIGAAVRSVQRGLFGQACYLFGVMLAVLAAADYFERGRYMRRFKLAAVVTGFVSLNALVHLLFAERAADGAASGYSLSELYGIGASGGKGGGAVGGFIADTLHSVLGYAGAYLILIVLFIICAVIITEKSFVSAAKTGAEKTAAAVRHGAGRTVEAAKEGRERYSEYVSRKEQQREESGRKQLHGGADNENGKNTPSLSSLTLGTENENAEEYIKYGREIIGEGQPGVNDLGNVTEPFFRKKYQSRQENINTNYDTQVINMLPEEMTENKRPVSIKEIDYNDDTVPFEETKTERYKSYAGILNAGSFNAETAGLAGFAAGNTAEYINTPQNYKSDTAEGISTESFDAFRMKRPEITLSGFDDETDLTDTAHGDDDYGAEDKEQIGESESYAAESYRKNGPSPAVFSDDAHDNEAAAGIDNGYISQDNYSSCFRQPEEESDSVPDIVYGPDGFAIYGKDTYTADADAAAEDKDTGCEIEQSAEAEDGASTYFSGTGKVLEAPDAYEAALIMEKKRRGISASSGETGGTEAEKTGTDGTEAVGAEAAAAKSRAYKTANESMSASGVKANCTGIDSCEKISASAQAIQKPKPKPRPYVFPKVELLERGKKGASESREEILNNAEKLEQLLRDFGVGATVTNVIRGPRVYRYEIIPDTGVKVSRITGLADDIKLALAATELRIEAPIPGKSAVGIEVPNSSGQTVRFRDILESDEFKNAKSKLSWGIGLDINGKPVIADIAKMPHLLVAGTTGSGKSVGINSLIMSILYRATPEDVRMILVDPKVVELSVYNGIPHLLTDVVTKPERAVSALNWAVAEMNNRYKLFQQSATRNIAGYNEKAEKTLAMLPKDTPDEDKPKKLPYILIVIDELSELMMHSKKDVESAIVSLTQLARAAGLHLVVATQRPSVDVITGLIKSNIPSRIAYRLPSQTDSRTILDSGGAETLLGNGDMLYKPGDKNSPARVQGAFLSDDEVESVVEYIRKNNSEAADSNEFDEAINAQLELDLNSFGQEANGEKSDRDELFADAGRLIIGSKKASIGALQRKFKVGFNRAARIMDQLHEAGVVSDSEGTKERQILMDENEFERLISGE